MINKLQTSACERISGFNLFSFLFENLAFCTNPHRLFKFLGDGSLTDLLPFELTGGL